MAHGLRCGARVRGWGIVLCLALASEPARAAADKVEDLSRALTSDPNFKVRLTAALVLGKLRDRRGQPALLQGLADKNETVRGMSASSLGSLGDPSVVSALEPLERDKSDYVRARAKEAIAMLRPAEPPAPPPPPKGRDRRVFLALGSMNNKTNRGGAQMIQRLRESLVKQIGDAPGIALDARPDGYVIDSSIDKLVHKVTALGVDVVCEVSFIVMRMPSRGIVGMTSGGATLQVPRRSFQPAKEEAFFEEALDNAVKGAHPSLVELFDKVQKQKRSE